MSYAINHFRSPSLIIIEIFERATLKLIGRIAGESSARVWAYMDKYFPHAHLITSLAIDDRSAKVGFGVQDTSPRAYPFFYNSELNLYLQSVETYG